MAEHELNKIVDDDGEVFNLRDNTKVSLFDSTYVRNNASGDGWVKIAEVPDIVRGDTDVNAVWDVLDVTAGSAIGVERIELSVRFYNSSNPTPSLKVFNRYCLSKDTTASFSFAVKITGLAGSGNTTKVELWAWVKKGWYSLGIRESLAGSISPSKTKYWTYFSYSSNGGSSKPVADASNNIQVADPMVVGENRTKLEDISKGANLVVNGCGTMCSNYNWPDFEWVGDYAVNSSAGSFKRSYSGNDNSARVCTEYIQVDPNKKVEISVDINVLSALVACDIRMTILFYDIDKKAINAQSIMYGAGTLTELTQDLNPGDTVIHLSSVANWTTDIGQTYKRGFIFWDYQNSFGYTYPPETYSWNYYINWFDSASDVNATTNTITLNKPWDGPKKLAGTKLSKCDSGGTYNYVSTKNVKTTELGQWFHLSGLVSGVATTGDNPVSKFRQGTAFIKVGFVNGTANANYTYLFTNFRVYELPTRLSFARDIRVNLGSETAASFDGSANVSPGINGTLAIAHGGTGATSKKAAEYAINGGMAQGSGEPQDSFQFVFSRVGSDQSATNGVFLYRTAATIWSWIKGKNSSVLGLSESNGVKTFTGNAATASAAQSGSALETAINGKMNTSASNATAPSGSGGDGATATLLNNLTEGNSDIAATDDGDNVLIATTDNGGSVTNKWYKRKLVKLVPWIIKKLGTRLVYDCGAGSTSGDDFDAALAAFNAGQWVIIHSSSGVYYCVGTYSGGLRFKKLSNEASLLKVDTITWNSGSAPTAGNQIEASLSGHTHGNITSDGKLRTDAEAIGSGDSLVVTDYSNSAKIARTSVTFDGTTTTKALTPKGTWETFVQDVSGKMNTNAGNAASGALQNLTAQLTEGTSDFTDKTEIFTSYAGNSGFAESGHVNQPYRRKASSMLNYIESKRFYERNPADNSVGTDTKRIQLGYGAYGSGLVGYCCYIVHIFFNLVGGSLQGKGVTLLVNYDWRDTQYQNAKCQILSDNGLIDAGYQIVLANFKSDNNSKVHVCLGLVSTSAPTTLVQFAYSYCKIFRLCSGLNWTHSIASDNVGSYNDLIPSEYVKAISIGNANVGNANQPVYFSNGVPVACNWWVS